MHRLFGNYAGLCGDPAMVPNQVQVRSRMGWLEYSYILCELFIYQIEFHIAYLTLLSIGVRSQCHGLHAGILCLWLWPTHSESRKAKSNNDAEGTLRTVTRILQFLVSIFHSFFARFLNSYTFLISTLPALLCQSSFLQAHFEHYQDVYSDAISTYLHPELVPHYLLCAFSHHRLLHAGGILRLRIPMHASSASLGQDHFRVMYWHHHQLVC